MDVHRLNGVPAYMVGGFSGKVLYFPIIWTAPDVFTGHVAPSSYRLDQTFVERESLNSIASVRSKTSNMLTGL
jgi:hypothetical protein